MITRKRIIIGVILAVILVLLLQSFEDKQSVEKDVTGEEGPKTIFETDTLVCTASSTEPQIERGDIFAGFLWNDPHVIKEEGYSMFLSGTPAFDQPISIYRLVSRDGQVWTSSQNGPVLTGSGMKDAWDSLHVETPSVAVFKGQYYLFYTGEANSEPTSWGIGRATSVDGINWVRDTRPILKPNAPHGSPSVNDFMQYITAEPGAIVFQDTLYLFFSAVGTSEDLRTTVQTIGMISSKDGSTWSKPQMVLFPDQHLYPREEGWIGYSTPHAVVVDNALHLFFDVAHERPLWTQKKIHHAISLNGSTWIQDESSLIDRSNFAWTQAEIRSPAALFENGVLKLWFAGHDVTSANANLAIGMVECHVKKLN